MGNGFRWERRPNLLEFDMSKRLLPISMLISAGLLSACSFSDSSKSSFDSSKGSVDSSGSISESASSPFLWSSRSLESKHESFERDVADYTAEFAKSSKGDLQSFRAKIGKLADKNGITNWEEDKTTYVAIGKGLRKAGLTQPQYEAFKTSLGNSQDWKMDAIHEGYR